MNTASNISILPPLFGVRVISIALNLPGPACVRRLADFGASVTKVEPPSSLGGDPMQRYAPGYYEELHKGQELRTLNLKDPQQRLVLDELLATADVFISSQRESALSRLKLAGDALSTRFPSLCHIAIVGDENGNVAGHDLTYLAESGLTTPPQLPPTLFADLAGAERAVTATFAALRMAQLNGRGHHCVVSLRAAAAALDGPMRHGLTCPGGLLAGTHPGYTFYRAVDGWLALAALEPHFIERLLEFSGATFTKTSLQTFFGAKSITEWKIWATKHDIPLSVIRDESPRQSEATNISK